MKSKHRPPDKRNPVAKYGSRLNRATVYRDRSKYSRRCKHKGRESFSLAVVSGR